MSDAFEPVLHCQRCYELRRQLTELVDRGPGWCADCRTRDPDGYVEQVVRRSPNGAAATQTGDALALMDRRSVDFTRFPFTAFDPFPAMTPGSVTIIGAASGLGKTTVTTSMIDRWVNAGTGCYVVPLETRAHTWRVGLACHRIRVHPGDALTGEYKRREEAGDSEARDTRAAIKRELETMRDDPAILGNLYVAGEPVINVRALTRAAQHA
jgi:hypothetical protein